MAHHLSKSRILEGLQCPKRLYLHVYRSDLQVESPEAEYQFAIGQDVGAVARKLYPGGKLIGNDDNLSLALEETGKLLQSGETLLYEATFEYHGVLIRTDILRISHQGYQIIEVKIMKDHALHKQAV